MGRSKLYNNKEAKQLVAAQESLDQAPRGDLNRGGKGGVLGVKQRGKFVRDTRRRAKTENNWLHGRANRIIGRRGTNDFKLGRKHRISLHANLTVHRTPPRARSRESGVYLVPCEAVKRLVSNARGQ